LDFNLDDIMLEGFSIQAMSYGRGLLLFYL